MKSRQRTIILAVALARVLGVGAAWSQDDGIPENALFVIPSDAGEYTIVIAATMYLVLVDDPSDVLTCWTPETVLPLAQEIAKDGITLHGEDGRDHHFPREALWEQVHGFAQKALGL